jgi:membrane protease YdiL (CAAX protease family)
MKPISNLRLLFIILFAVGLFAPMFVLQQAGPLDFWWWMSLNLLILTGLGFLIDRDYWEEIRNDLGYKPFRKIILGLASTAILYGVFWIGNYLSRRWFDFAGEGIAGVYSFKGSAALLRIGLMMVLIIGPGEELFWRGFLQRQLSGRFGKFLGFSIALVLYTGIHIFTGNIMLILAAFICGLFWGFLYLRYRSVLMIAVSHTIWDIMVFLVAPFVV